MTGMDILLRNPGEIPAIGPERGRRPQGSGVTKYVSPHGSVRYVAYSQGLPVSALQVVTRDGRHAQIAQVYTVPSHRRTGWASKLLARARQDFASVSHARERDRSEAGAAWASARPDPRRRSRRSRRSRPTVRG